MGVDVARLPLACPRLEKRSRMERRLRLALIGGGLITESAHLPSALACDAFEIVALVDPVQQRGEALARKFGIRPVLAQDVRDVLGTIDAAVIATPNHTHAQIAVACLERGVSVLIEKPLACSPTEGRAILETAARCSAVVAPGYVTRFRRNVQLLRTLLRRGHFGAVRRFVHQFGTPGGWAPLSAYNLRRESAGGGVLVVTGTHFLDRMLFLWGMPDQVEYWDDSLGGPEANCVARFRFLGARVFEGEVRYSKTMALPAGLVIETEAGVVRLADSDDADVEFWSHDAPDLMQVLRPATGLTPDPHSPFVAQLAAFAAACRGEAAFPVPALDAVRSLELLERLYGCRQALPQDWYEAGP